MKLLPLICFLTCTLPLVGEMPWEWSLKGEVETTFYQVDGPSPSLLKFSDGGFLQTRFSLSFDLRPSEFFYFHSRARIDRGFDPGDNPDGALRLDEVFLRYRPFGDARLNLQLGKSATVFGNYVSRHDFHDDPFLVAPLPYGEILGVAVRNPAGNSLSNIAGRASGRLPGVFNSPKRNWASAIWGPAYTSGVSIFGAFEKFDYALEIKNVEAGAHPNQWDASAEDFDSPTIAGRLGYRPNATWNFGASWSRGPYLNPEADRFLPVGTDRGDLPHTMFGVDARWARGDVIFSGEAIFNRYERLSGEDLESLSWYLQARWKAAPGFWLATRLGQTLNNEVSGLSGERLPWSPDLLRAELAAGWRVTPDLLLKTQYSYTKSSGGLEGPGSNLFGFGVGWRF